MFTISFFDGPASSWCQKELRFIFCWFLLPLWYFPLNFGKHAIIYCCRTLLPNQSASSVLQILAETPTNKSIPTRSTVTHNLCCSLDHIYCSTATHTTTPGKISLDSTLLHLFTTTSRPPSTLLALATLSSQQRSSFSNRCPSDSLDSFLCSI